MDQLTSANVRPSFVRERRLDEVTVFGSNPGNLRMHVFEPARRATRCPCVVVLHGCTQTPAGYDTGSGWSRLAEEHCFCLLFPQQQQSNNEKTCFSWFLPGDTRRGKGEVESIRQMIEYATGELSLDADAIFICGLSAGGAMAGAMMANHPELFAGGAIIAGLPFGAAENASEAFHAMLVGIAKDARLWGDLVRGASSFDPTTKPGSWPTVSIWYGTNDAVVRPINAGELVKQWTDVHGVGAAKPVDEQIGPASRRTWFDEQGSPRVRSYALAKLGHGAPVDDHYPPAPFFLPAGVSSTRQIAADFRLLRGRAPQSRR